MDSVIVGHRRRRDSFMDYRFIFFASLNALAGVTRFGKPLGEVLPLSRVFEPRRVWRVVANHGVGTPVVETTG